MQSKKIEQYKQCKKLTKITKACILQFNITFKNITQKPKLLRQNRHMLAPKLYELATKHFRINTVKTTMRRDNYKEQVGLVQSNEIRCRPASPEKKNRIQAKI